MVTNTTPKSRLRMRALSAAVATCFAASPAWSLPTAPTVVNGTAAFNQAGNVLTVTNSDKAIINWQQFGISAGELTRFIQASASSSVLNRVVGGNLSAIYGSLQSNGRVWLVNPAGILVGPGATIDTAAFVASTLAIRNEDFLAGKLTFSGAGGNVVNQGSITTPTGGSVYLIGANVSNEGIINTPKGEVILAAGETVNLVDTATPGVKVEITGAAGNTTNLGEIAAEAGRIGMAGVIVRNSGTLNASSAVEEGGKVFLKASQDTYVDGNGRIVATGTKGGRVEVLGNRVAVMDSASIDVSGTSGGGKVLVGGDFQGKNPGIQNSQITYFGKDSSIKANAGNVGDGGTVIVWADDTTRAYGSIQARGGDDGGNGGFVETSGKRYLNVAGARVDTRASKGATGSWLLDPTDVTIIAYGTTPAPTDPYLVPVLSGGGGGWFSGYVAGGTSYYGATVSSVIYWENIDANLASNNIFVTTTGSGGTGNIYIQDSFTYNRSNALTFLANNQFNMPGTTIRNLGSGNISVLAGWDNNPSTPGVTQGTGSIHQARLITNGNVTLKSGGSIGIDYLKGANVTINAGYSIWDDNWTTPGAVNIESPGTIQLNSGGVDPMAYCYNECAAISTDIAASPTTIINATTVSMAPGGMNPGGITVRTIGTPAQVHLNDYSSLSNLSTNPWTHWVEYSTTGSLTTGGNFTFYGHSIYLDAAGDLTYAGGASGPLGSLQEMNLYAGRNLTISTALPTTNSFTGLVAGSMVTVNAATSSSGEIGIVAGITPDKLDQLESVQGPSDLARFFVSTNGTININAPVSAGDSVGMMAGNINLNGSSGHIFAYYDIFGIAGRDITLTNGAHMKAGYDVYLGLLSPDSTLYLNKTAGLAPSYILADYYSGMPTSINLAYPLRSSGGIVIDGVQTTTASSRGSGLYVLDMQTPARPGFGLNIFYGQRQVDSGVVNTLVNTVTNSTNLNTDAGLGLRLLFAGAGADSDQTAGGGEGEFGEGGGDGKGKDQGKKPVRQCRG